MGVGTQFIFKRITDIKYVLFTTKAGQIRKHCWKAENFYQTRFTNF